MNVPNGRGFSRQNRLSAFRGTGALLLIFNATTQGKRSAARTMSTETREVHGGNAGHASLKAAKRSGTGMGDVDEWS